MIMTDQFLAASVMGAEQNVFILRLCKISNFFNQLKEQR